jgi:hypothetical protein
MKKTAKNCTLYHVVNKSVWADIGAASTSRIQYIGATDIVATVYWCYLCWQHQ